MEENKANREWQEAQMAALLPAIAAQLRVPLSNLGLAVREAIPEAERESSQERDRKAAVVDQSYYLLLRLVDNLTNAAWLSGTRKARLQSCDIVSLVSDFCVETIDLAEDQRLTLTFKVPDCVHICAVDPEGIRQILFQLLSNAMKFTPPGGWIRVELQLRKGWLVLSVSDGGEDVPDDLSDTLMERCFHPERMDPPPHGLGLGLPLCRAIAEAHGGRVLADTPPGGGCRIMISIPDKEESMVQDSGRPEYNAGFNKTLLGLADALPSSAFRLNRQ